MAGLPLDFAALFDAAPNPYMVLDRELRYVAANRAYLQTTNSRLDELVGRFVMDVFPNDPSDPNNANTLALRASFEKVRDTGKTDELAYLPYRVRTQTENGLQMVERFWSCTHTPLLDAQGKTAFILQHTVDVTEIARLRANESSSQAHAEMMRRTESVQQAKNALEFESQHLRRLFEQTPGFAAFLRGREHVFELANPAYLQVVGHREILGKPVREALPELVGQGFYELLDRVFTSAEPFVGRGVRANLQRLPGGVLAESVLDFVYQPIVEPNGAVSGIFVSGHDRTDEHLANRERERLAALVEQSHDWIASVDLTGRLTYLNAAGQKMLGLPPEKIPLTLGAQFFSPEDLKFVEEVIWPAVTTKNHWEGDFRHRHFGTGELIPVHYNVFTIRDAASGELTGVASVSRDMRERHAMDRARREAEAAHQFLADSIPEQVWTAGVDGALTYVNERVSTYFGREAAQVLGAGWQAMVHPDDLLASLPKWQHSLRTGEPYETEFRLLRHRDQSWRWHVARAIALRDTSGQIAKWYGTNTDIDDYQRTVKERDRLISALEQSNRELDRFAYVASHDLKTPLRGIGSLAQWIEEDSAKTLSDESRNNLRLLRVRVSRMNALIEGILSYSRSGRHTEPSADIDTRAMLTELIELISPPAPARVELGAGLPTLKTPLVPLQQIFINLIGNALKHAGRVDPVVVIEAEPTADGHRFVVTDNGQGIDPRFHSRIWELFQTLESKDRVDGAGIGLSVVKKIVESRGGTVSLESSPGRGSRFSFTWPTTPQQ